MRSKIFLSYRREDTSGDARSIYQYLSGKFGKDNLFIDVDKIEKGRDFRESIERNLAECRVLVAVIGPKWLSCQDEGGKRRLENEEDFVRLEISKALAKDIVVIPVLVGNSALPKPEQLPKDLQGLVFRHAALVRHESFPQDMEALERDIRKVVGVGWRRQMTVASVVALLVGIALLAGVLLPPTGKLNPDPSISATVNDSSFVKDQRSSSSEGRESGSVTDKDIASVMQRCVRDAAHPDRDEILRNISTRLSMDVYEYGWSHTPGNSNIEAVTWKKITQISVASGELLLNYEWRNGRLRLIPVVQEEYAARSAAPEEPQAETILQGSWSQNNGYGCVEVIFDDTGDANVKWGIASSDTYDSEAFIRKKR